MFQKSDTSAAPLCLPHTGARNSTRTTRAHSAPPGCARHSERASGPTAIGHIGTWPAPGAARATRSLAAAAAAHRRPRRATGAAPRCRGSVPRASAPAAACTSSTGARSTAAGMSHMRALATADAKENGRGAAGGLGAHLRVVVRPRNDAGACSRPAGASLRPFGRTAQLQLDPAVIPAHRIPVHFLARAGGISITFGLHEVSVSCGRARGSWRSRASSHTCTCCGARDACRSWGKHVEGATKIQG